ncbi:hypothetical protein ACOMHN_038953 [Nucella lapillus]
MLFRGLGGGVTVTFLIAVITCMCRGQTNNTVNDASGSIVWGQLAPDTPYKTVDYTADVGGLDPYYALAVSLIDSSLPETLPVAKVKDILENKADIGESSQDLAKQFVGYSLCVVIGLLFILIFPIVACCFCCCRCCGNCGGKRIQQQGPKDRCKRIGFSIALAILSLFVLTGAACVFVTSDQVHKNLDGLSDSFSDAVDDFDTFVDNIDNQFRRLGDTNFVFLTSVLKDYVETASSKLSGDLITAINKAVGLNAPLNHISSLSGSALVEVGVLESQVDTLTTQRDTAKNELTTISNNCADCLKTHITFLDNMPLTAMRDKISTFKTQVSTNVFDKMKTDLNASINGVVEKETGKIDVANKLDQIHKDKIKGLLDKVTDFKASLNGQASDYQKMVEDVVDFIKPYDKYRWYAGVGLASLLGLIAVMMLVGVILGVFCGSAKVKPTERGSASNCGGICLMAAVGLVFIFGALLMLLCTLMYMTGSPTERYVCQSIDHLDRLEKYTQTFNLGVDLSNYTFKVNGEQLSLSVNQFMSACEEGKTLYTALGLKGVVDSALKKIDEYKTELDKISNIDASAAASQAGNVDVSSAITALEDTVTSIDDLKNSITTLKGELEAQQTSANAKSSGAGVHYDPMINTLTSMETTCDNLRLTSQRIKTAATNLNNTELPNALARLKNETFMTDLIKLVTNDFVQTIFGFVDSYISDIRTKLENDVAKCSPFYSITNAILAEAACHGIIDPLNGFWLALGWCLFFFMPSLILAVKLAKHYRTMLSEDSYDSTTGATSLPPYYTGSSAPPKTTLFPQITGPNNKVAPF